MVAGLFLAGCSSFVESDSSGNAGTASGTNSTQGTSSGSTSGTSTTGGAQGSADGSADDSADGSADVSTSTTGAASMSTSSSDSSSGDSPAESSESTGSREGFPFEANYTGSFNGACQIEVNGSLALAVDADGIISGTATAAGQVANVGGTVDLFGAVDGNASIGGPGGCDLTGTIAEGNLIGTGSFNCPNVPCSGTWTLVGG